MIFQKPVFVTLDYFSNNNFCFVSFIHKDKKIQKLVIGFIIVNVSIIKMIFIARH